MWDNCSILKEKMTMNKNSSNDLAAGSIENPILRPKHWLQILKILSVRNKPLVEYEFNEIYDWIERNTNNCTRLKCSGKSFVNY